jgi:hypothetical protein
MRALLILLIGLMTASSDLAFAQMKPSPKAAPAGNVAGTLVPVALPTC